MNAFELAELIRKRTGERISLTCMRRRMSAGLSEKQLLASPRKPLVTAIVDGEEMDAGEISTYVEETYGYYLSQNTVTKRIKAGRKGKKLIAPSISKNAPVLSRRKRTYGKDVIRVSIPGWGYRI